MIFMSSVWSVALDIGLLFSLYMMSPLSNANSGFENLDGQIKGRNFAYKPIFIKEVFEIGQTHMVQIVDATNHSLIGEIAS